LTAASVYLALYLPMFLHLLNAMDGFIRIMATVAGRSGTVVRLFVYLVHVPVYSPYVFVQSPPDLILAGLIGNLILELFGCDTSDP
jgi:hypothetical protein